MDRYLHLKGTRRGLTRRPDDACVAGERKVSIVTDYTSTPTADRDPVAAARDKATTAVENISERAAEARDEASRLASRAQEKMSTLGREAANRLDATKQYFREHDAKAIAADAKDYARSHPTQALIGAAAVGFLIALVMRRR